MRVQRKAARSVCAGIVNVAVVSSGVQGATLSAVLVQGDEAPGTGRSYQTFDRPSIAANGLVAFGGDLDGATGSDDIVGLGELIVAREGDLAPGAGGAVFDRFDFFQTAQQVNTSGQVAYIAELRDGAPHVLHGVFLDDAAIAVAGDGAIDGETWESFSFAGVTEDGRVGFVGEMTGPSTSNAALVFDQEVLYRKGGPVPGLPEVTFDGIFDDVQWNEAGDLLFEGNTSLASSQDRVLFRRWRSGAVDIVAQEGQAVATSKGTELLGLIEQSALASDGRWAIRANLQDAPGATDSIVLSASGLIMQQGDPVTGMPGVVFGDCNGVAINAHGDVAFLCDLDGATAIDVDEAIFVNGDLVVHDGMPAPGLPEGTILTDLGFEDVVLNDAGQLVFAASYAGAVNGDGLFMATLDVDACPMDLDGSGAVDGGDIAVVIGAWGACDGTCAADLDGDGRVDMADLLMVLASWGACGA